MGYFIQKNFVKGYIEERRVNGVGVNYSINLQFFRGAGCKEEPDSGSFSINNATGSERRYFSLAQTFDLGYGCDTSSIDIAEKPITLKDRGTGPLPTKYKSLYSLLEGRTNIVNDTKLSYPSDASYKEVDAELTKTSIIFNLLQVYPEELNVLSPENNLALTSEGEGQVVSGCCVGELMVEGVLIAGYGDKQANLYAFNNAQPYPISGTLQRTTVTSCFKDIKCEGTTWKGIYIYNCDNEITEANKSAGVTTSRFEDFLTGDYKYRVKLSQYVKLGCCKSSCFTSKIRVGTPININSSIVFKENSDLVGSIVYSEAGLDSKYPPVFKSCDCIPSPLIEQTSTTSIL